MKWAACFTIVAVLGGCDYTGTVAPPPATACMPYTFTAVVTLPPGVTGTLGTVTGFPASMTVAGPTVSGTPTWLEAGSSPYTINASGTVTSPASFWRTTSWSGSSAFVVNPPPATFAPVAGFTIPAFAQLSNPVTITVAPAGTVPCPYTAQYPNALPGLAQITVQPASPQASDPADQVTLQLSRESNAAYTGTLTVTLTPTGGGPNVTVSIPVTAL